MALPTETVYGLAADALDLIAVAKIFEAKERPQFDPLIVHLPGRDWLERVAAVRDDERQLIGKLTDGFWPGPFTIVLPKREIIPDIVTAGLDTVAVRISSHPVFAEIIERIWKAAGCAERQSIRSRESNNGTACPRRTRWANSANYGCRANPSRN